MSFAVHEESLDGGKPIHLYRFKYGPGAEDYICYTDAEKPIRFKNNVFDPVPIERGKIVSTGNLDKASIDFTLPDRSLMGDLFRAAPPSYVITLEIYNGHDPRRGEETTPLPGVVSTTEQVADFVLVWAGRIISYKSERNTISLNGEPISTALQRPGLRRNYQRGCPHVLYGPECRAVKTRFPTTITAIGSNQTISVATGALGGAVSRFLGGTIEWTNLRGHKSIFAIYGTSESGALRLNGPPMGAAIGMDVDLFLGCDHTRGPRGCALHNNILNFGGHPWIPLKNPVSVVSPYY